jgi:hypothetical protein
MSQPHRPGSYVPPAVYGSGNGGGPLVPWLVVGGAVLVSGLGLLLVVLLGGRDPGGAPAAVAAAGSPSAPDGGSYADSDDVARTWVEAMRTGDHPTAFGLSCAQVRAAAAASAPGANGAEQLGAYFLDRVLDGDGFTAATLEGVDFDASSDVDVAGFTLTADDGRSVPLEVLVVADGTVCGFR